MWRNFVPLKPNSKQPAVDGWHGQLSSAYHAALERGTLDSEHAALMRGNTSQFAGVPAHGVIGIDVDFLKKNDPSSGNGWEAQGWTFDEFPVTLISTARGPYAGSGIVWGIVPAECIDWEFDRNPVKAVQVIRSSHADYAVLPPSVNPHAKGAKYCWYQGRLNDMETVEASIVGQSELGVFPKALLAKLRKEEVDETTFTESDGEIRGWIEEALGFMPFESADDYFQWLFVGMALHWESNGSVEGLQLFIDFSKRSPKYVAGEPEKKWASFSWDKRKTKYGGRPKTGGYIWYNATLNGWNPGDWLPPKDIGVYEEQGDPLGSVHPRKQDGSDWNDFWTESPELEKIWRCATVNHKAPRLLLAAMLALVGAAAPFQLRIDLMSNPTPISLYVVLAGRSGAGKSSVLRLARHMLGMPKDMKGTGLCLPSLGSPVSKAGLLDLFGEETDGVLEDQKAKVWEQTESNVLIVYDEMEGFHEMSPAQRGPLTAELRTAWTGGDLMNTTSKEHPERNRHVPENHYNLGLVALSTMSHVDMWLVREDTETKARGEISTGLGDRALILGTGKFSCDFHHQMSLTEWEDLDGSKNDIRLKIPPGKNFLDEKHRLKSGRNSTVVLDDSIEAEVLDDIKNEKMHSSGHWNLLRLKIAACLALLHTASDSDRDGSYIFVTEKEWALSWAILDMGEQTRSVIRRQKAEADHIRQSNFNKVMAERKVETEKAVRTLDLGDAESVVLAAVTEIRAMLQDGPKIGTEIQEKLKMHSSQYLKVKGEDAKHGSLLEALQDNPSQYGLEINKIKTGKRGRPPLEWRLL